MSQTLTIEELKPTIRAILMSLGKVATENEFRKAFEEMEGRQFSDILKSLRTNFFTLFNKLPDVCNVAYTDNTVILTRVSSEATSHMTNLTVNKYKNKYKGPKVKIINGKPKIQWRSSPKPRYDSSRFAPSRNYNQKRNNDKDSLHRINRSPKLSRNTPSSSSQTSRSSYNQREKSQPREKATSVQSQSASNATSVQSQSAINANSVQSQSASFAQQTTKINNYRTTNEIKKEEKQPVDEIDAFESPLKLKSAKVEVEQHNGNIPIKYFTKNNCPMLYMNKLRFYDEALEDLKARKLKQKFILRYSVTPMLFSTESIFEIKIFDVVSPSRFTFQYSLDKLKHLMIKMNEFYETIDNIEDYKVKEIELNMIVAVCDRKINSKHWYRAQVKAIGREITINYLDHMFTSTSKVTIDDIYHLDPSFTLESPKSAVGRLFGMKPKEGDVWSSSSIEEMKKYSKRSLKATVNHHENDIFSLTIFIDKFFTRLLDDMIQKNYADRNMNETSSKNIDSSLI